MAIAASLLAVVNQALFVNPNPLDQERAFIGNDISASRLAYGLDGWTSRPYPATTVLTADALVRDAETFANARLWDYRPLGATLDQLQTVRQYYDFADVDIDRYIIDDKQRQVMLSGREMALDKNPTVNNWLNAHFVYTHGYGVAMVPVNAVQPDGLPDLIIRDLPVVSEPGAPVITEPRIYFGERPAPWVVTGAQTNEFDYPANDAGSDATNRWTGTTGIDISDGINRLLLSIWTGDFVSLLTSPQITDQSQFLMRRTLDERLHALAPVPVLRRRSLPRHHRLGPTGLDHRRVHLHRPVPHVAGIRGRCRQRHRYRRLVQLRAQLGEGRGGRLRRHDHAVRQRPHRPAHRDLGRGVPDPVHAPVLVARRPVAAPALPRGPVQRPDGHVRGIPRHGPDDVLSGRQPVDGAERRPGQGPDAAWRGVLRPDAAAGRGPYGVPAHPADGARAAART